MIHLFHSELFEYFQTILLHHLAGKLLEDTNLQFILCQDDSYLSCVRSLTLNSFLLEIPFLVKKTTLQPAAQPIDNIRFHIAQTLTLSREIHSINH